MKKLILFVFLMACFGLQAQETPAQDLMKLSQEQRREYLKTLSPEQRRKIMKETMALMLIKRLEVPAEKQDAFKKLLTEFHESQKAIRDKFQIKPSQENLGEDEARRLLSQSFELSQQLLNNRKGYTERFLKILTPQQVLKLYDQEKKMRENLKARQERWQPAKGKGPDMPE